MRIPPIGSNINSVSSIIKPTNDLVKVEVNESHDTSGGLPFKNTIQKAIGEVNHLQNSADDMAVKLASGDVEDVHQAMISMQKAKMALDLTIQVRNKVIEAYQEIMRMQV